MKDFQNLRFTHSVVQRWMRFRWISTRMFTWDTRKTHERSMWLDARGEHRVYLSSLDRSESDDDDDELADDEFSCLRCDGLWTVGCELLEVLIKQKFIWTVVFLLFIESTNIPSKDEEMYMCMFILGYIAWCCFSFATRWIWIALDRHNLMSTIVRKKQSSFDSWIHSFIFLVRYVREKEISFFVVLSSVTMIYCFVFYSMLFQTKTKHKSLIVCVLA
jgi:hypothetical protein